MLSKIDLLVIQTRGEDVKCSYGGPSEKRGKFVAWIDLYNRGDFHRHILNTNDIFDSAEAAQSWAKRFVAEVRRIPVRDLFEKLSSEDMQMLNVIINEVVTLEKSIALAEKKG